MLRRTALSLGIGLVVAAGVVVAPGAHGVVGEWTRITSPKGPGQAIYPFARADYGTNPTVSGVVSDDFVPGTDTVTVYCFSNSDTVAASLSDVAAITASHTFSVTVNQPLGAPCVFRAIPSTYTGISGTTNTGYVGAFAGPSFYPATYFSGGNVLAGYGSTPVGAVTVSNAGGFGLQSIFPIDDMTKSSNTGAIAVSFRLSGGGLPTSGPGRSSIRIDGHDAYTPYYLDAIATQPADVPHETFTKSLHSDNTFSVTETVPLRRCQETTFPPSPASCTMQATGVTLIRQYVLTKADAVATVRDRWVSVDGNSHHLDLQYTGEIGGDFYNGLPGWIAPGKSSFSAAPTGAVSGLRAAPATIVVTNDIYGADGELSHAVAGLTYSSRPSMRFGDLSDPNLRPYAFSYLRTVTAKAAVSLGFGAETAFRLATVRSLAQAEQAALKEHLAITAPPARVRKKNVMVAGKVTNLVNGVPGLVRVQIGSKHKIVPVSAKGLWSVKFAVSIGRHTIKATATDPGGVHLVASRKFRRLAH